MVDKMLRVDHAGEFGAVEIYSGQVSGLCIKIDLNVFCPNVFIKIAVLKDSSVAQELHEMKQQEVYTNECNSIHISS